MNIYNIEMSFKIIFENFDLIQSLSLNNAVRDKFRHIKIKEYDKYNL